MSTWRRDMHRQILNYGGAFARRRSGQVMGALGGSALVMFASISFALAQDEGAPPLGATVGSVLAAAHQLSPELRAAALETEAASARVDRADALDDPMLSAQTMQVPGSRAHMDQTNILVQQEFPLWGKLGLRKSKAEAMLDSARGGERATAAVLDEKIKVAFARYYAASQALAINTEVTHIASEMQRAANARYGQGIGGQADALMALAEGTKAKIERLRLQGEHDGAAADLNALLARAPNAPLAEPSSLTALPNPLPGIDALTERVRSANPVLFAEAAQVRGAEAAQELAEKAWYPDVTVGAGPQSNLGSWGYTAMVGVKIPLEWGAKEADEREANANLAAARQRLMASAAEVEGELGQAIASLAAAEQIDTMRRTELVPQLTASYKSALAEYASGHDDLSSVLETVHRLHETELELLQVDVEAQSALAMIERLIGGEL